MKLDRNESGMPAMKLDRWGFRQRSPADTPSWMSGVVIATEPLLAAGARQAPGKAPAVQQKEGRQPRGPPEAFGGEACLAGFLEPDPGRSTHWFPYFHVLAC